MNHTPSTLFDAFSKIPDPRHSQGRRHPLPAVMAMTVAAMLCGATSRSAVVQWGRFMWKNHRPFMKKLGFNSYTTPVNSTLMELFNALDIDAAEKILSAWINGLLGATGKGNEKKKVSIDGKTLRGSSRQNAEVPGVHLISAYLHEPGCVVAQMKVDEKTNEHKGALELIEKMILKDTVVVGDAIYCQRDFSKSIIDRGGDYFLVVKDNQSSLKESIETAFMEPSSPLGGEALAG